MWKPTISFPNWEADETGNVRRKITSIYDSKRKQAIDGYYYPVPRQMASGYLCVGSNDSFLVHRMVAEAFIPNPSNKPQVNHKDGNKSNLGNKWNVGRKHKDSTKQKISQKLMGNRNGLGTKRNEETRRILSQKAKEREARKRNETD